MNIKRVLLVAVLVAIAAAISPAYAGEAYISGNGGMFKPGTDYGDDFDPGLAGGLSYIMVNEYAGFEFGLSGYTTADDINDEDIVSLGLEMLVHFHKTDSTFQPFIALGLARYRSTYSYDILGTTYEDTDTGGGGVIKLGARLYLSDSMFIGAYYKRLTNEVDFSVIGSTVDLGGDFIFGEIGIVTF